MCKFPIKIDLSAFFSDERKFVMILIDSRWETVASIQRRINEIFGVCAEFVSDDGYFIPLQEPIDVIKHVKGLKAFVSSHSLEKNRSKGKKKRSETLLADEGEDKHNENPSVEQVQVQVKKKRKIVSLESCLVSSTPNDVKRRKHKQTGYITITKYGSSAILGDKSERDLEPSDCAHEEKGEKERRKSKERVSKETRTISLRNEKSKSLTISPTKKKKMTKSKGIEVVFRCNLDEVDTNVPRIFQINGKESTAAADSKPTRPHIEITEQVIIPSHSAVSHDELNVEQQPHMDGNQSIPKYQETVNKSHCVEVDLNGVTQSHEVCNLSAIKHPEVVKRSTCIESKLNEEVDPIENSDQSAVKYPEITNNETFVEDEPKTENSFNDSSVISVDADEKTENEESTIEEHEVIDLNETDYGPPKDKKINGSNHSLCNEESITVAKILPFATVLESLPSIGDIVLFKLKYAGRTKEQKVSDFIVARCEYINKRTKSMKVFVIDSQSDITDLPYKFLCDVDDSSTDVKCLNIKLSDLHDAKIFEMPS